MLSSRIPQLRRRVTSVALHFATARPALFLAFLVALSISGAAEAQEIVTPSPQCDPDTQSSKPNSKFCLEGLYDEVVFESFLVEANYNHPKSALNDKCPNNQKGKNEEKFVNVFCEALNNLTNEKCSEFVVNRVAAPTGYGKSALLRYLMKILNNKVHGCVPCSIKKEAKVSRKPVDRICMVKLDELASTFAIRSMMLDELKNEDGYPAPAFAKLRAFDYDDHAAPGVEFLTRAFNPNLSESKQDRMILIIDSIDEIHPESAKSLLARIDEYINFREKKKSKPGGFLHVFVMGRAEGFSDYYRITQGGVNKTKLMTLNEPCIPECCQGAAIRSAARFVLGIKEEDKDKSEINNQLGDKVISTTDFLKGRKWLYESFRNLADLNELVKVAHDFKQMQPPPVDEDDFKLKETLFQSLLGRARDSHNRPLWQSEKYVELLEKIALEFPKDDPKNKKGTYFSVKPSDVVQIDITDEEGFHTLSYLVESVLNRSGVAELDPDSVNLYVPRYRFYPTWVHQYLTERAKLLSR